jgi:hypothetical protein
MTEPMDRAEETALWRHWRTAVINAAGEPVPAPDPLLLAAYAEHRLSEDVADAVEAWLVLHPEAMADVLAARASDTGPLSIQPSEIALARAMALVLGSDHKVVPFRRPARPMATWRTAVARIAVAASLLIVSLVGFGLGTDAYTSVLNGGDQSSATLSQDLFDPPSGIFSGLGEESSS